MSRQSRWLLVILGAALTLGLAAHGDAQTGAVPTAAKFQLPDAAFDELIQESNKYLAEEFQTEYPSPFRVRADALMVALASQHRMAQKKPDLPQLATMRDAAVRIARVIDLNGDNNMGRARKHAEVIAQYPKIKVDQNVNMEILRLKSVFQQEDVDFHFKNKNKQVPIERELFTLQRLKKPLAQDQMTHKYEMIGYKLALLAEQLRDFDENVRPFKVHRRKEWVSHATDVQYSGWDLADVFRNRNTAGVKAVVTQLTNACAECHSKFRCD